MLIFSVIDIWLRAPMKVDGFLLTFAKLEITDDEPVPPY